MNTELYKGMGYHAGAWEPERTTYTDCPDLLRKYVMSNFFSKTSRHCRYGAKGLVNKSAQRLIFNTHSRRKSSLAKPNLL